METSFQHRSAIGVWINDVRNEAFQTNLWPPMTIDWETEASLQNCIDTLARWGYNELCLWGLLNSYSWSPDFSREKREEIRLAKVRELLRYAHRAGLKVLFGLGVYSWGYDHAIRSDAAVRGTSVHAMCGSKDESFAWVARVIDFILGTLDVDGFHLESADQGRCRCEACAKKDDFRYHCELNTRVAAYVKRKWPDKIVMTNMISWQSWDRKIRDADAPEIGMLCELGKYADYIIDPGHLGHYVEGAALPALTAALPCAFGNAGGYWSYYWPVWNRLRTFLPYTRTAYDALRNLHAAGGRAVEYYTGPMRNPGAELNTAFAGYLMSDVTVDYRDALEHVVEQLYRPKTKDALHQLADVVIAAESSWFSHWTARLPESWKPNEADAAVTFDDFEAYSKSPASRPCQIFFDGVKHLTEYMKPDQWPRYRNDLQTMKERIQSIQQEVHEEAKLLRMITCLINTIRDLDELIDFERWK